MLFKYKYKAAAFMLSFLLILSGCSSVKQSNEIQNAKGSNFITAVSNNTQVKKTAGGNLKIHYINVGQGDSELIQQDGKNMLIDTGTNASANSLISYLKKQRIKKIDYLVLTHPHEDHIGGADAVISTFDIGTVYMPKVTTTTKTFKDVIIAMKKKKLKAAAPVLGAVFKLGHAGCMILGPVNSSRDDLNTYSIVLKVNFGNNKFLFTGDAQAGNENDMIAKGYDLSADVLKVGHHGSHTSTSVTFLNEVNPHYAVISCGMGNDYGHPHKETMQKLKAKKITVYRTDECGNIICTSNGENISFNCKPGDYKYGSEVKPESKKSSVSSRKPSGRVSAVSARKSSQNTRDTNTKNDRIVYWTPKGKSYHYNRNCKALKRSKKILSGPLSRCPKKDPCNFCVH